MSAAVISLVLAASLAADAPAVEPLQVRDCVLPEGVELLERLADLPPKVQQDMELAGPMVAAGEPYNDTDAVQDLTVPFQRFVAAGRRRDIWFVWYERGGISRSDKIVGWLPAYRSETDTNPRLVLAALFTGNACAAIRAVLDGAASDPHSQQLSEELWKFPETN